MVERKLIFIYFTNDTYLDQNKKRNSSIITGPIMASQLISGGRRLSICVVMAQIGKFAPASQRSMRMCQDICQEWELVSGQFMVDD